MAVNIGDKPLADFADPLGLMVDCHRRIERFLLALQQLARSGELDDAGFAALGTALDYFVRASPRHNEDEEYSLFPALLATGVAAGNAEAAMALARIDQLKNDHKVAEDLHHQLDELGRAWLVARAISPPDLLNFQKLADRLASIYAPHIAMEERDVFPVAARVLAPQTLASIGEQMRARRAADPGREGSRCAVRRWEAM